MKLSRRNLHANEILGIENPTNPHPNRVFAASTDAASDHPTRLWSLIDQISIDDAARFLAREPADATLIAAPHRRTPSPHPIAAPHRRTPSPHPEAVPRRDT
ncbi:hypothetical protein [Rhodopirellula sp. SWK7]|uniref:hypothetical protein n=1 Tax=Rhodopirellula sp. SWK7 TaxID=595460 RepID=UPI0005C5EEAC|nr:hypothetical protein [Rhodopirellula sp. SWK7]